MGNWIQFGHQSKEVRVIYVTDESKNCLYPLSWPDSFAQLVLELKELFPGLKGIECSKIRFVDGTKRKVDVCNESTFAALIPSHQDMGGGVQCFYICLEKCLITRPSTG